MESIQKWKDYLSNEDYNFLINYINNLNNDIINDKILILYGEGGTGKTTLINDIRKNIKQYKITIPSGFSYDKIKCIYEYNPAGRRYYVETILDSFEKSNQSIIIETISLENIDKKILEKSKIIYLTNVFNSNKSFPITELKDKCHPHFTTKLYVSSIEEISF